MGAHTCAVYSMTLKLEGDLDILKMYPHTENCYVLMIYEI